MRVPVPARAAHRPSPLNTTQEQGFVTPGPLGASAVDRFTRVRKPSARASPWVPPWRVQFVIIGILGGIGAGKSTVVRMLRRFGAQAIDADELAHETLESPAVRRELVSWLGTVIVDDDGRVDRKAVGKQVFADPEKLERLEALVHPGVRKEITRQLEEFRRERRSDGPDEAEGILVLDVPLLASTPLRDECDALVFVDASLDVRRERVKRTRGWPAGELEKRESHQMPVEEKRRLADFVIDNSQEESETLRQVEACLGELRKRARAGGRSRDEERHEQGGS